MVHFLPTVFLRNRCPSTISAVFPIDVRVIWAYSVGGVTSVVPGVKLSTAGLRSVAVDRGRCVEGGSLWITVVVIAGGVGVGNAVSDGGS